MNFSNYGELISVYEAAISEKAKVIVDLNVIYKKLDQYNFMNDCENIKASLIIEDDIPYYNCTVSFKDKNNKPLDANMRLNILTDISVINNILRNKIEKDDNIVYTATTKSDKVKIEQVDDTTWTADMIINDRLHLKIDVHDLESKIVVNKDFINIFRKDNKLIDHFTIGENTVSHLSFKDNDEVEYITYIFDEEGKISYEMYPETMMKPDKYVCSDLVNLSYFPNKMTSHNVRRDTETVMSITYDDYGIPKDDSFGHVRYEEFYDEDDQDKLDSIISLHPLYMDLFNQTNTFGSRIWVLDQLLFSEVDSEANLIFYDSEVRVLSVEEESKLIKELNEAPEDEPILDFIDIDDFIEGEVEYNYDIDTPSTVRLAGITWINKTNLFTKDNNFAEIKQFEEGFRKTVMTSLMDYCYEVEKDLCHRDRDTEWRNELFSFEDMMENITYSDATIDRTESGGYNISVKIKFTKYVSKVWSNKDVFIENEFDVFNERFVFHDGKMRKKMKK